MLGLERRVPEARKVELVEGRHPEARPPARPESGPGLLDDEGGGAPPGRLGPEHAVVLDAGAAGQKEPLEDAELLLEEPGLRRGALAEAGAVSADVAVLAARDEADRARAPGADVEVVDPLGLPSLHVDLRDRVARREEARDPGVLGILEAHGVLVPRQPKLAPPPRHGVGAAVERRHQGLALLARVDVDDGPDGEREERLAAVVDRAHRQPCLSPVVAQDEGERAVARQGEADAPADGVIVEVVVAGAAGALGVRRAEGVVDAPGAAAEAGLGPEGVVVADLLAQEARERPLPLLREDVDDAPDRVSAVERRLRPPDDLDAVDQVGRDVRELRLAQGRAGDPHAVDQHLDLGRIHAPDRDARGRAEAPRLPDVEARDRSERVLDRDVVVRPEVLLRDHADGRAELLGWGLDRGRGHHDWLHLSRLLGPCRRGAPRQQEHEHHSDRSHRRPLLPRKGSSTPARGQVS